MKIFLIPSIYPTTDFTQLGIYVKEHCEALKKYHGHTFVVLNATTTSFKNWNKAKNTEYFNDSVGKVIQHYTIGFMQSRLPRIAVLSYWMNLKKMFNEAVEKYGKPDLLYAHFSFPGGYSAMRLSSLYNIPYVVDEHYSLYLEKRINPYISRITRQTIINSKGFICVSEKLRDALYQHTGLHDCISVIPNLINERYVYHTPVKKEKFVFFSAGNFFKNKNFDLLIRAFSEAFSPKEKVQLIIAGDGLENDSIRKIVKDLGRSEQIILPGRIDSKKMLDNYINCDCFTLLSGHETFGIAYREALAVGRPIISSKNGGIEEGWNNQYGILLNETTVECASNALRSIYDNCDRYDGRLISQMCRSAYSEKVVADQVNCIISRALENVRGL